MGQVSVQIRGFSDLSRGLKRLGADAERALGDAALTGAAPVLSIIQRKFTPGHGRQTGNLVRSYHTEPMPGTATSGVAAIGTDVEYAPFVEFGTSRMAAQAQVRQGLEEGAPVFADEAARALGDIIAGAI